VPLFIKGYLHLRQRIPDAGKVVEQGVDVQASGSRLDAPPTRIPNSNGLIVPDL
jgi:hypothetical protein